MPANRFIARLFAAALLPAAVPHAVAQGPDDLIEAGPVKGFHTQPALQPFDESLLQHLRAPQGFKVNVFAQGLEAPRMMAVFEDTVFVTRRDQGDVLALRDTNGDGVADETYTALQLDDVHGIEVHGNQLYLVTIHAVYVADLQSGGGVGAARKITGGLPDGGPHPNRTIDFGPDGFLYISVGSTCNACDEPDPEHATLLQAQPDGSTRRVYARGLRNTIGFDWHPDTGQLWGMDQGSDWRGDDTPPEELNRITQGADYGWPWCFGAQQIDLLVSPPPPGDVTREQYCTQTEPAAAKYQAHAAAMDMVFYDAAQFPSEYQGDAFVTFRGSWNRSEPVGYNIVRVRFENGEPVGFEDFLTGFLLDDRRTQFGRPVGLALLPDGSLLMSEDENGVIYRVSFDQ